MPGEIVLESLDRIAAAAARVERHGIDISIARAVRLELGGAGELGKRLVLALQPHQCEAQRVMQACVLRRGFDRLAQHALGVGVTPKLPVEIGEIGRGRAKGRTEPQRRLVLRLSRAPPVRCLA